MKTSIHAYDNVGEVVVTRRWAHWPIKPRNIGIVVTHDWRQIYVCIKTKTEALILRRISNTGVLTAPAPAVWEVHCGHEWCERKRLLRDRSTCLASFVCLDSRLAVWTTFLSSTMDLRREHTFGFYPLARDIQRQKRRDGECHNRTSLYSTRQIWMHCWCRISRIVLNIAYPL